MQLTKKDFIIIGALLILFLLIFFISNSIAQEKTSIQNEAVDVFLDGFNRFEDYIKTEITLLNYVRDPKVAQLYILMTRQQTGGNGYEYTITFEGQKNFTGVNDTLKHVAKESDTEDMIRKELVKVLTIGLIRYVSKTPFINRISADFLKPKQEEEVVDKWNYWVFSTNVNSYMYGEESTNYISLYGSFSANRINHKWKTRIRYYSSYYENNFKIDDETISSFSRSHSLSTLIVRSINDHWSIGGSASLSSSTYSNTKLKIFVAPAIEYNLFPYSKSTWRQFRFLYRIGGQNVRYNEETIYFKTKEFLGISSLTMALEVKEKWGTVCSTLEASFYLHDFGKNRLDWFNEINIRIFKGFSINMYGGASRIRDQLSLPGGGATYEEILLRRSQLATGYEYYGSIGLSYTFGSIYNNIVNPRFGN